MWRGFSDHLCPRMRGLCLAKGRVDEKRKTMGPPPRKHRYFDAFPVPQSNSILNCPVLGSWRLPYPQLSLKKHPSVLLVLTAYCASSFMITATWCVTKTVVCDANLKRVWTLGNDAATGDTPSMQAPWTLSAGWDPLDIYIYRMLLGKTCSFLVNFRHRWKSPRSKNSRRSTPQTKSWKVTDLMKPWPLMENQCRHAPWSAPISDNPRPIPPRI